MASGHMFKCDNGDEIPYLQRDYKNYLHRSTALFGPTETGKTVIIREILFLLKDVIPVAFAVAPSDQSNETYSSILPPQCIYDKFNINIIKSIYQRQQIACKIFNRANNIPGLMSLFKLIDNTRKEQMIIMQIVSRYKKYLAHIRVNPDHGESLGSIKSKQKAAKESRDDSIRTILKNAIRAHKQSIAGVKTITSEQKYILKYLDFNPETLLILDDCADEFKSHNNNPLVRMLFYKAPPFFSTR